jgi:gamma-glutamyltranspeptidase/glutathione hydrolase
MFLRLAALCLSTALAARADAAEGANVMIASEHALASEAGLRVSREGGNAVDAAVATALAVGVVNPSSCGIGGGGFMLIFDRASGKVHALDYRETAPAAARSDMFDGRPANASVRGGLAVAVPGEVAGLHRAWRRFGSLPWAQLVAPAISYARDGFAIEEHLAEEIAARRDEIAARPSLASLLLHPDGRPLAKGERLRQPELAATLERVATLGPTAFYDGPVASAIARSVEAEGGVLRASDLRRYRTIWRSPVGGKLEGNRVWSMPPPSSGGGVLVQILETLSRDDLRALERNSPT